MNEKNQKEKVKNYFDRDSDKYEKCRYNNNYSTCHQYSYLVRKKHVLDLLEGSGNNLLDVGCGPGTYTGELLFRNYKIIGIDISNKMIDKAKKKFSKEIERDKLSFLPGEIYDLKDLDGYFDKIICIGVVSYIPNLRRFLNKISSLLKPNGILIIQISKKFSFKSIDEEIIYPFFKKIKNSIKGKANSDEFSFNMYRYTVNDFKKLCFFYGLKFEKAIHYDYSLPILNIFMKSFNIKIAQFLENHNNKIIQSVFGGDYVARFKKDV